MGRGDKNKRICIRIVLESPKEIMAAQLLSKLGVLYYLCCGVFSFGSQFEAEKYCACCCICLNSDDIVSAVAEKISIGLAEAGILNEVQFDGGGSREFTIVVRKMNSAKQVVAKGILQKKIREKLRQSNIEATIEVTRSNHRQVYKTTEELQHLKEVADRKKAKRRGIPYEEVAAGTGDDDNKDMEDDNDSEDEEDDDDDDDDNDGDHDNGNMNEMKEDNENRNASGSKSKSKSRGRDKSKDKGKIEEKDKEKENETGDKLDGDKNQSKSEKDDNKNKKKKEKKNKKKKKKKIKNKGFGKNRKKGKNDDKLGVEEVDSDEDDWGTDLEDIDSFDVKLNETNRFMIFGKKKKKKQVKSGTKVSPDKDVGSKPQGNVDIGSSYQKLPADN